MCTFKISNKSTRSKFKVWIKMLIKLTNMAMYKLRRSCSLKPLYKNLRESYQIHNLHMIKKRLFGRVDASSLLIKKKHIKRISMNPQGNLKWKIYFKNVFEFKMILKFPITTLIIEFTSNNIRLRHLR
jgi:hypothetical protein